MDPQMMDATNRANEYAQSVMPNYNQPTQPTTPTTPNAPPQTAGQTPGQVSPMMSLFNGIIPMAMMGGLMAASSGGKRRGPNPMMAMMMPMLMQQMFRQPLFGGQPQPAPQPTPTA